MTAKTLFLGFLIWCLNGTLAEAQPFPRKMTLEDYWQAGTPFITAYTPEDYNAKAQNWGFIQGNDGTMYVANGSGILEFDGVSWRLIKLPKGGRANSFAKRNDGTIFIGGSRDFGFLLPDSIGQMEFHSLLPQLEDEFQKFSDVWHTYATGDTVYFITEKYIFRLIENSFKIFRPKRIFGFGFMVNNEIYVEDRGTGLMHLVGDSLQLIPEGSRFSKGGVAAVASYGENKIMLISVFEGAFVCDDKGITPLKHFQTKERTYGSTVLQNGDILIYSLGNGAYCVDKEGYQKLWLTKEKGLISNIIYGAFVDKEGGLWLATDNGINRIEIASPLRNFTHSNGLTNSPQNILYTSNGLYASSNNGLFRFSKETLGFERVAGVENMTRNMVSIKENILVGNMEGLYKVDNKNKVHTLKTGGKDSYNILFRPTSDSTRTYVAGNSGHVYEVKTNKKDWQLGSSILSVDGKISQIIEGSNPGIWWIATYYNGIYKVSWSSGLTSYDIIHFGTDEGLPVLSANFLHKSNKTIHVSSEGGIYKYDEKVRKFVKDISLMDQINLENLTVGPLATSGQGMWIPVTSNFKNRIYKSENNVVKEVPASRRFSGFQIYNIHDSQRGIIFFSGPKGIIAYNEKNDNYNQLPFPVQISHVFLKNDSLLYGGHKENKTNESSVTLPFTENRLRFAYALPSYNKPEANEYQYFLEGFDQKWSTWTTETQQDFTNIPMGRYTFKVRGRNIFGEISEEDTYSFIVLRPWYHTWWAYLLYALVAIFLVWLFVYWRSQQLRQQNLALEAQVNERTEEIRLKNEALGKQAKMLKEVDTMKTRLFANISHEFRTPLTLIKGPIEKLEAAQENNITTTNIKMIRRNANRLLKLVNQLLDLSKLDSGKLQLNTAEGDIFKCIRAAASAFSSHAASRNIDYQIKLSSRLFWTVFDRDKLENIIYNLLSNSFKFTQDEGRVIIEANYRSNELQLVVSDTGCGIHRDKLPHIFDRFFQVDDSYTKEKAGSGIGLALTRELVQLMKGEIYVESELDKGSKFKIIIPLEEIKSYERNDLEEIPAYIFDEDMEEFSKIEPYKKDVKVLIIEDNNDMRHFIKEQLSLEYNVLEARNGKEGLQIAEKAVPALIITDLMMPQMDGISLCKKLKTSIHTSHIPVIMLTAKAGIENKLEGLEIGADDYLTKPFNARELQIRTKNLIVQRRKLRELFSNNISLDPKEITVTSLDEEFVKRVIALLEEKHGDNEFGVPQMQKALAMSKTQLHIKIKALANHPPGELLRIFRLKRAAQLLRQQNENITQVAYDVGFNSLSYFTKCFKEYYGKAPTEFIHENK